MKNYLIISLWLFTFNIFAQDRANNMIHHEQGIYLYVNPLQQATFMSSNIMCDCGINSLQNFEVGAFYQIQMTPAISLELGAEYDHYNIKSYWFPDGSEHSAVMDIDLLSFPAQINYHFAKYFYIQTGLLFDFQLTDTAGYYRDQTGIGATVGLGAQLNYQHWRFFLKPNYKRHAIVTVEDNGYHRISEFGVQFGFGYVW